MALSGSVTGPDPRSTCHTAHVSIPSFTDPGKAYETDPVAETCTCRRFEIRKDCEKHVALAEALVKMRSRRDLLPSEDEIATGRLIGLAKRIYSKPKKRETFADSYDLYLEIAGYRYATPRLVEAARLRHKVRVEDFFRRAA